MKRITVSELLALKPEEIPVIEGTKLPKIIHQSWKATTLPPFFARLQESWDEQYPDYLHVLWQDADNLQLVKEHYPDHLDLFKAFPAEIYRADFSRNLYMHRYGGIYIDLDYSSFKCLSPLLREHCAKNPDSAFVGVMPLVKPGCDGYTARTLYNAIFASTPGHPFWKFPLEQAKQTWESSRKVEEQDVQSIVGQVTGPQGLTRAANAYHAQTGSSEEPALVELPAQLVYPYAWYPSVLDPPGDRIDIAVHAKHDFDLKRAVQVYDNGTAYCSTWWSTTWKSKWVEEKECSEPKLIRRISEHM